MITIPTKYCTNTFNNVTKQIRILINCQKAFGFLSVFMAVIWCFRTFAFWFFNLSIMFKLNIHILCFFLLFTLSILSIVFTNIQCNQFVWIMIHSESWFTEERRMKTIKPEGKNKNQQISWKANANMHCTAYSEFHNKHVN